MDRTPNTHNPHEMPYGHAAFLLGLRAFDALYDLCDAPKDHEDGWRRWVASDLRALQGWFNIEDKAPLAQAELEMQTGKARQVSDLLHRYRVTLPFDESERHWLYEAYAAEWGPDSIDRIRHQKAEIVSAGMHRPVVGRDLLDRWWAWRREINEYKGQGTLELACEALRELVETASPDIGLPETYTELRNMA